MLCQNNPLILFHTYTLLIVKIIFTRVSLASTRLDIGREALYNISICLDTGALVSLPSNFNWCLFYHSSVRYKTSTYLSMSSKSRLPHCIDEGLLAFRTDDGLGCFDGFELTSGGLLVLVGIALTARSSLGSVTTAHEAKNSAELEKLEGKEEGRIWGGKLSTSEDRRTIGKHRIHNRRASWWS